MKKLILAGALLITSLFSFSAFAISQYGDCPKTLSDSEFCHCFYKSCYKIFGSGQCQYNRLVAYFAKVTPEGACSAHGGGADRQQCIEGITRFINVCH